MLDVADVASERHRRIERGNRRAKTVASLVVVAFWIDLMFQPGIDQLIGAWRQQKFAVSADGANARYSVAMSSAYNVVYSEMEALLSFEVGALPTTVDGTVIGFGSPRDGRLVVSNQEVGGEIVPPEDARIPRVFEGGTIRIPRIGLNQAVVEGVSRDDLRNGPGHYPGTALPGRPGNVVISGHRTTYTRPFYDLDLLDRGDVIWLDTPGGSFKYLVEDTLVVDPSNLSPLAGSTRSILTLTTCNPKGSARERLVVVAALAGNQPLVSRK